MSGIEDVRQELTELEKLNIMTDAELDAAFEYMDSRKDEIDEYLVSMSVTATADLVRDLASLS